MPFYKGINCELFMGKKKTEEYKFENDSKKSICKSHIVALVGKKYSIKLDFSGTGARRHNYKLYADGIELTNQTSASMKVEISKSNGNLVKRKTTGGGRTKKLQCEEHQLKFGKFGTVDGDIENTELRTEVLDQLGTLKIIVWRANFRSRLVKASGKETKKTSPIAIHEESVKGRALSHVTKLGRKKYANAGGTRFTKSIDPENKPFVTFIYRYASKGTL
ncbi:hypothetical protein ABW21_db0208729 [Orbilia brochopaga]|nr:hypothetical protein ABW21_db0208729 [Drechslerella brochopaga]